VIKSKLSFRPKLVQKTLSAVKAASVVGLIERLNDILTLSCFREYYCSFFVEQTYLLGQLHLKGGFEKFLERNNACGLVTCMMCSHSYSTRGAEKYEIFKVSPLQLLV